MKRPKNIRKTTIELTEEQYFFLKERAIDLHKKREDYSIVSIIRRLINDEIKKDKKNKKSMCEA